MADILWLIVALANFICAAIFADKGDVAKTILYCFNVYLIWQNKRAAQERRDSDETEKR